MKPMPMKPKINIAQVEGSGTAVTFVAKPVTRTVEFVVQGDVHANMWAAASLPCALAVSTSAADAHVPLLSVSVKEADVAEFVKPSNRSKVRLKVPNELTLPDPAVAGPALANCGVKVGVPAVKLVAFTFTSNA